MNAILRAHPSSFCVSMTLAAFCFVLPLGAQPAASTPAAKPKVKLAPRPLPGTGSSHSQDALSASSPEAFPDVEAAQAKATAKVPLFRPAAVNVPGTAARVETLSAGSNQPAPQVQQGAERARILYVRRRGTFTLPKEQRREAPVIVNDLSSSRPAPVEAVPAALPPGKIRIVPRESVKIGTPPPQP